MFVKSFWIWVLYTSLLVTVRLNAENSCTDQPPTIILLHQGNETEYPSIASAMDAITDGDHIILSNLISTEGLIIDSKSNIVLEAACNSQFPYIQIESSNNIKLIGVRVSYVGSRGAGIYIKGGGKASQHLTFDRLVVDGNDNEGDGIKIGNKSGDILVRNTVVKKFSGNGIHQIGSKHSSLIIESSKIHKNGHNGIILASKLNLLELRDSTIFNNGQDSDDENGYGIKSEEFCEPYKALLINNTISNNNGAESNLSSFDISNYHCILDENDSANITTLSREGVGVSCPSLLEWNKPFKICMMVDYDGDAITAQLDNCPLDANIDQLDEDNDGIGSACDSDEGIFIKGGPDVLSLSPGQVPLGWVHTRIDGLDYYTPLAGQYYDNSGVVSLSGKISIYFPPGALIGAEKLFDVKIYASAKAPAGKMIETELREGSFYVDSPRHRYAKYLTVNLKISDRNLIDAYAAQMVPAQYEESIEEWVKRDYLLDIDKGVLQFRTNHFSWVSQAWGEVAKWGREFNQKFSDEWKKAEQYLQNTIDKLEDILEASVILAPVAKAIDSVQRAIVEKKLPESFGVKIPPITEALDSFDDCFTAAGRFSNCVERLTENGIDAAARMWEISNSCSGIDTIVDRYNKAEITWKSATEEVWIAAKNHAGDCIQSITDERFTPEKPKVHAAYAARLRRMLVSMESNLFSEVKKLESDSSVSSTYGNGLCLGLPKLNQPYGDPKDNGTIVKSLRGGFDRPSSRPPEQTINFMRNTSIWSKGYQSFSADNFHASCKIGDSILFGGLSLLGDWNQTIANSMADSIHTDGRPTRSPFHKYFELTPRQDLYGYLEENDVYEEHLCNLKDDITSVGFCSAFIEELMQKGARPQKPFLMRNVFSKDMSLGLAALMIANYEKNPDPSNRNSINEVLRRYINYVNKSNGDICQSKGDRCTLLPTDFYLKRVLEKYSGLSNRDVPYEDVLADNVAWQLVTNLLSSGKEQEFNAHLVSIQQYLRARAGHATDTTKWSAKQLFENRKGNLWFEFLDRYINQKGEGSFNTIADRLLSFKESWWDDNKLSAECKTATTDLRSSGNIAPCRKSWSWEQNPDNPENVDYEDPSGHEIYMLGKLLTNDSPYVLPSCGFEGVNGVNWDVEAAEVTLKLNEVNSEIYSTSISNVDGIIASSKGNLLSGIPHAGLGVYRFGDNASNLNVKNYLKPGTYTVLVRNRFNHSLNSTCEHTIRKIPKPIAIRKGIAALAVVPDPTCPIVGGVRMQMYPTFNLNADTNGPHLNLCYLEVTGNAHLTGITTAKSNDSCPHPYLPVGLSTNAGAGGNEITFCQKLSDTSNEDIKPITKLLLYEKNGDHCPEGYTWVPQDLNEGTKKKLQCVFGNCRYRDTNNIYLCYSKE